MKDDDCKECLNARLIVTENGYKPICTLSARKAKYCLVNDKCNFEGSLLYNMIKGRVIEDMRKESKENDI